MKRALKLFCRVASGMAAFCFVIFLSSVHAAPSIEITNLPSFGSFNNLGGRVLNAGSSTNRVAVFIFVPGAGWYTKPTCGAPLTIIDTNGSWTADITTGGADQNATQIAALLVSSNYNQPCVQDVSALPTNVLQQAIASVFVTRDDPSIRRFDFSDYNWSVKSSIDVVGPGPNYFSDSTNNVWLDALGQLHLRITNRSNNWQCAEVVTRRTFGYGQYRFSIGSPVGTLNRRVILGLFTWSDDDAYDHREIDVEFSRWNNASDTNAAQFVVQPFDVNGHLIRFPVPADVTNSTSSFIWQSNRVDFQSVSGDFASLPEATNILKEWSYQLTVPPTGDENIRINLWLYQGNPPSDNQEAEVIIRKFEFVPLGLPQPAQFSGATLLASGAVKLNLLGAVDRRYQLQKSSNLLDWLELNSILATNNAFQFFDSNAAFPDRRFYRAITEP